ncbi:FAD-dependent dehydrogenase [Halobacteroides halobius DSM 5150]|uniref:FAD-dependent dehydrogenase n=1 Tax=Halobacteroides halobius (strain ATCC 35273 / DSM 5150 / MD-1) TaxID=748449 RepID=L0KAZ4_HALHC|nr:NAD(P)/FAD-dependent oxidoreductase [Halobacteroides halobius]AGB42186.1 FAD-dependent dehydrogenase [Halobacteroides halobius DSM 5150]
MNYNVVIVGAGPAGIFTALELVKESNLDILIIEKGRDIIKRDCPMKTRNTDCVECSNCSIVCGWGGAGAYSDGKLTLSSDIGGNLDKYIGEENLKELVNYTDNIYCDFGAPDKVYGPKKAEEERINHQATLAELNFIPAKIRHLGTGYSKTVLSNMKEYLLEEGVEIKTGTKVTEILTEDERVIGVKTEYGTEIKSDNVVVAPGRENAEWLTSEAERLGIKTAINPVDIGVRVELPAAVMKDLTDVVYESKFIYHSPTFDDKVRTFCMCPNGEVVNENNDGLITVNGHSHATEKTENTNFALLVSKTFTEPFKEPITYGQDIAKLANLLGGRVLVQRLGDFLDGRRSTSKRIKRGIVEPTLKDATPGDLSLVLPYRHLTAIDEMLQALDEVCPGVYSRHTLLYGVEVKFYSSRLNLKDNLETKVSNLYAGGDGAGVTRGLIQASSSGVVIARNILNKY